ncbi:hypothetical protein CR513_13595, partial [Mucuna pruriens]
MAFDQVGKERKLQLQELAELRLEAYKNSRIYKKKSDKDKGQCGESRLDQADHPGNTQKYSLRKFYISVGVRPQGIVGGTVRVGLYKAISRETKPQSELYRLPFRVPLVLSSLSPHSTSRDWVLSSQQDRVSSPS